MIGASSLKFLDEIDEPAVEASESKAGGQAGNEPKVFVRTISTPPGWPWEQSRSADLEARYGAPLPLSDLLYRLRRLQPWRPGAAARFAAFYVLAKDAGGELQAHAEVDGKDIAVSFGGVRHHSARAARVALQAIGIAAVCLIIAWSAPAALSRRAETAAALDLAEHRVASKLRVLEAQERLRDENRQLNLELDRGTPLREVISDLAWASAMKAPDAHVEALHWRGGQMALEVRGTDPPFPSPIDRPVERSKQPIRRGIWLWGIGPALPTRTATGQGARR